MELKQLTIEVDGKEFKVGDTTPLGKIKYFFKNNDTIWYSTVDGNQGKIKSL